MEHKIEMTLTAMGEILSKSFQPSHRKLYALRKLGIKSPMVHHMLREKKLSSDDKKTLYELFNVLNQQVDHYGVGAFEKYYINLFKKNLVEILNSEI
jgi:hypothetical protein